MQEKIKKDLTAIGERLKIVRKKLNLTLTEMLKKTQFSKAIISEVENGKRYPSSIYLYALCTKFNVNINYILTGEGDMFLAEEFQLPQVSGEEQEQLDELLDYVEQYDVARYRVFTSLVRIKNEYKGLLEWEE